MKKMKEPAIILGLGGENALGVIRSLSYENIPSIGFHEGPRFPSASYSKYLSEKCFASDKDELLVKLLEYGKQQKDKSVIFCTGDEYVTFIEKNANQLDPFFILPLSGYDSIENIIDKTKVLGLGKKAGFFVPQHSRLSSDDIFSLDFPVFLKPLFSVNHNKKDMSLINTKEELNQKRESLLEDYIDMEVETFIPGPISNQAELHAYLDSKGEFHIGGMLQFKYGFSEEGYDHLIGWHRESVFYKELIEPSKKLAELLKFNGALDINVKKHDENGNYYFHEVNLRTSANLMIDTAFGLNLPAIIYSDLSGLNYSHLLRTHNLGKYWIFDRRLSTYASNNLPVDFDMLDRIEEKGAVRGIYDPNDSDPFYYAVINNKFSANSEVNIK